MKAGHILTLTLIALTVSGISSMQASSFNNNVGLGGVGVDPGYTITFDNANLTRNSVITDQFAFAGVTFSTPLFYDGNSAGGDCRFNNFDGGCVTNFTSTPEQGLIQTPTVPFSIYFTSLQTSAAFALVTENNGTGNTVVQAFLGDTLVESSLFTTGSSVGQAATVPNFIGFYDTTGFDRILVTTSGSRNLAMFDNIQVSSVPEPGTLGLLALGLAGGVAVVRRRRAE